MDKATKVQLEQLIYFINAACAGYTMQGEPPPLYEELKAAANGNLEPIKKVLGL